MATQVLTSSQADQAESLERRHRRRWRLAALAVAALLIGILAYGLAYYPIPLEERGNSPLHNLLRPSGAIGLRLGQLGFALMLLVYLYGLRKRWLWLRMMGNTRHWLDFHILMGIAAPLLITFHSSFKFQGLAGVAFWVMWVVVMSGFVGRYFYGQIPRSLNAAELSMKELETTQATLAARLAMQRFVTGRDLAPLFRIPSFEEVQRMSLVGALTKMLLLDLARPFHVSRLRRKSLNFWQVLLSFGGMLPIANPDLEEVIATVRRQSWISMKIGFLGKAHAVFHLWHIIHRPFSYSLAVLALLHIVTALLLGYF
jgi:hypothetical protein